MDPSKTKFPALASLPVTSVILFSDKYINYQNHTKYCPGYRVLLSTGKWGGENLFFKQIPDLDVGLVIQWILDIFKIKKSYFSAYSILIYLIDAYSHFSRNIYLS